MKYLPWMFIATMSLCAGCATQQEHDARQRLEVVDKHYAGNAEQVDELPDLTSAGSISDYLSYAALKNAALESAFNRWKASFETITQQRTLPDPRFTYGYFIREVETKVGPQRHKFSLSQTFPWYGTLQLKGDVALQTAEAQRQRFDATKLRVFYRVKEAYYDYYFLGRSLAIMKRNLILYQELEKNALERYGNAEFKYSDLLRLQIETVKYAERIDSLNDFRHPVMARLAHVLNWSADAKNGNTFPYPDKLVLASETLADTFKLKQQLLENPQLKELDYQIAREEDRVQLAYRRYIPDVTLGVDYIETGKGSGNVKDRGKDPIIAMVSVNLPIYFTKYEAERREAQARKDAFQLDRVDLEKALLATLESAIFSYRDSKRKKDLYQSNLIPKAKKSLTVIKRAYVAGKASYLDFVDAQQTLLKFELIYEQNLVKFGKAIAKIEELTGRELASDTIAEKTAQIQEIE